MEHEESLESLKKSLDSKTNEKFDKILEEFDKDIIEEINKMGIKGPTVDEYFQGINPAWQYQKGYSDGAMKFKNELLKEINISIERGDSFITYSNIIQLINEIYNTK